MKLKSCYIFENILKAAKRLQLSLGGSSSSISKKKNHWFFSVLLTQQITILFIFRLPKIKEFVDKNDPGAMIIPFSGAFEAKFLEMDEEARKAFCEETKCTR